MEETTVMSEFITLFTSFVTAVLGWMNDLLAFVTENPVVYSFVLIMLVGSVIGIIRRWLPGRV